MSWNPQMEFNHGNTTFPYNSAGSFMNFFEGLAYEHVNFIFADELHAQENTYNSMHTSVYKFGFCEPGPVSYYDYSHGRSLSDHMPTIDEYSRNTENPVTVTSDQTSEIHSQWEGDTSSADLNANHVDCPRGHHTTRDQQVVWQDSIDPDNMSYEELLELGEAVGTQNRGLSKELISMLPVKKFKCGFFSRKRSRNESLSFLVSPNCRGLPTEDLSEPDFFYDDPNLSYSFGAPVKDGDAKRHEWLRQRPSIAAVSENKMVVVTGSQPRPCENLIGDHIQLRNKVDYCRIQGCDLFHNPKFQLNRAFHMKSKKRGVRSNCRCVICQMEYKRGDRQMTLPCKHAYHSGCGTKWLSINKACPICYKEVFADEPKQ